MNVTFCDLCKKQILDRRWSSISFPRIIEGDSVVEFYKESDICGKCMIALTRTTKVAMQEQKPMQTEPEKPNDTEPNK